MAHCLGIQRFVDLAISVVEPGIYDIEATGWVVVAFVSDRT